ncbi:hypothetical protein ACOSQ3_013261 [Xanthoceras sorbifolium]
MLRKEDSLILDCIDKWYSKVTIVVSKAFIFEGEALIDSGADLNCISEGIIPSQYFSETTQMLNTANGERMLIDFGWVMGRIFPFGLIIGIRWVLWWRCLGDRLFMILVLVFMLRWRMLFRGGIGLGLVP